MSNDERTKQPALTVDEMRLAKQAAEAKIAQAVHEAGMTLYRETGLSITSIDVEVRLVGQAGGRVPSYGLSGVTIEVERI